MTKFTPVKDRIEYGGAILGIEEVKAVMDVMLSQGGKRWTVGPESVAFEAELATVTGVKRAVVVNSGSSALLIGMTALRLPRGSKVIIPAVNFPTAFNAILQTGCIPVVVDVDETLNLDLKEVKKAVDNMEVAAVIAVNIAGNPVDLRELREIVGPKVKIILDNCDGYGTTFVDPASEDWKGERFVETDADLACVSFHAAHIITTGEGGACLTNDEELANRITKLREWGRASGTDRIYDYPGFPDDYKERYVYEEIGFNMKPLELQCAMGRVQLRRLLEFKEARKTNYERLFEAFKGNKRFEMVQSHPLANTCWFSFPLMCTVPRKGVMEAFEKNNIECRTIFSGNITRHPAYKNIEMVVVGELKKADDVMKRGMFLSCHPSVTQEMVDFIKEVAWKI